MSVIYVLVRRVLWLVTLRFRSRRDKDLEIVVLGHEPAVLRRQVSRPQLGNADRVLLAAASRIPPGRTGTSFSSRRRPCCAGIGCGVHKPDRAGDQRFSLA